MTEEAPKGGQEVAATPEKASDTPMLELSAFYGQKAGMTRIFDQDGRHVPVTVIKLLANVVTQVKTRKKDGYEAYQVGYAPKREKLLIRPTKGHLARAKIKENMTRFAEIRASDADPAHLGARVSLAGFTPAVKVDVTATSKGKGFQGVIKRHNFTRGPMAHGSKIHRTGGSVGNRATPSKIWKNKRMPGHMGCQTKTVQNLEVVEVNQDKGYMLLKGAVPGARNGFVRVAKARKEVLKG